MSKSRRNRLKKQREIERAVKNLNRQVEENNNTDKTEEIMTDIAEPIQQQQVVNAPPTASATFNPFNSPVKKRDYTRKMIEADMGATGEVFDEQPIPEPTYEAPSYSEGESTANNSSNTQPQQQSLSQPTQQQQGSESFSSKNPSNDGGSAKAETFSANPPLDDLDAGQKRKAAKKTAEAMLTAYQKFMPMPFKKIASFNMNKLRKLDMSGEISINMPVTEDGLTVGGYAEANNKRVDEIFTVTEEMKNELRDPLTDVLMEQNLSLTPTQRLGIAVGGQVLQFGVHAAQLGFQNKEALKTFKEFKAQDVASGRDNYNTPPQQHQQTQPSNHSPSAQEEGVIQEEAYVQPQSHSEEDVPSQSTEMVEESYEPPTFGLDDVLSD